MISEFVLEPRLRDPRLMHLKKREGMAPKKAVFRHKICNNNFIKLYFFKFTTFRCEK